MELNLGKEPAVEGAADGARRRVHRADDSGAGQRNPRLQVPLKAGEGEPFGVLMERVADGLHKASWEPGIREGIDLRVLANTQKRPGPNA